MRWMGGSLGGGLRRGGSGRLRRRLRCLHGIAIAPAQLVERALQPGGGERLAGVEAAHL